MRFNDPLHQVILGFSEDDPFTIRDSFEGVQIFFCIGSGKTCGNLPLSVDFMTFTVSFLFSFFRRVC
jgi:hypothetical protein